jgi:hypothetical protein
VYQSRSALSNADPDIHLLRNSLIQIFFSALLFLSTCGLHFAPKEKYIVWCVCLVALKIEAVVRVFEVNDDYDDDNKNNINNNNNISKDILETIRILSLLCVF